MAKQSFAVLKGNPALAIFPVISGIAVVLASIPFIAMLFFSSTALRSVLHGGHTSAGVHHSAGVATYVISAALYFVNMLIVVFFNAALVACANESLQGRPTTVGYGLQQAFSKLPQIVSWAAIAATVGMILRTISERSGLIGTIVTSLVGIAWNLAVFFVVPVLVIENVGPITAVKSSTELLKRTWGDRVILGFGVGSVFALLGLLVFVPIGLAIAAFINGIFPLGILLIIFSVLYLLVISTIASALTTIYTTALYLYSRNGTITGGFNPQSLQYAFQPKPQSKVSGFFG